MSSNLKKILICWLLPDQMPQSRGFCEISVSPLSCLSQATSNHPDLIVIFFNSRDIQGHKEVIELCKILKEHPLTTQVKVAVFLERLHQKLILGLTQRGVDFVDIHSGIESDSIGKNIRQLWKSHSLMPAQSVLEKLCPFLNYLPGVDKYEFPVCGAYWNRMFLGGHRLHEICHTINHHHCEYYKNPKVVS